MELQLEIVSVHPKETIFPGLEFFLIWRLEFVFYLREKGFEIIVWITSRLRLDLNTFQDLLVLEDLKLRLTQFGISKKIYLRLFRRFFIFMVKASG